MKLKQLTPCICCDHEPNEGDSVYYGMPIIKVTNIGTLPSGKRTQYYAAQCPVCKRGGIMQNDSVYKALQEWNLMQDALRVRDIFVPAEADQR